MLPLPRWMRITLCGTAVMNLVGAAAFAPFGRALRALVELPEGGHPLYPTTVGVFVLIFGLGYLWAAVTGRADRLFIAVAAAGKLSFFTLLVCLWAIGDLSGRAPLAGTGDLVFGSLFLLWLCGASTRGAAPSP